MKVFTWEAVIKRGTAARLGDQLWHTQGYAIVATTSKAQVARRCGVGRPSQLFNLKEGTNAAAAAMALARPGVVFIKSMQGGTDKPTLAFEAGEKW